MQRQQKNARVPLAAIAIPLCAYDSRKENTFGMILNNTIEEYFSIFMDTVQIANFLQAQRSTTTTTPVAEIQIQLDYYQHTSNQLESAFVLNMYGCGVDMLKEAFQNLLKTFGGAQGSIECYEYYTKSKMPTSTSNSTVLRGTDFCSIFSSSNANAFIPTGINAITYGVPLIAFHAECLYNVQFPWNSDCHFEQEVYAYMKSKTHQSTQDFVEMFDKNIPLSIRGKRNNPQVLLYPIEPVQPVDPDSMQVDDSEPIGQDVVGGPTVEDEEDDDNDEEYEDSTTKKKAMTQYAAAKKKYERVLKKTKEEIAKRAQCRKKAYEQRLNQESLLEKLFNEYVGNVEQLCKDPICLFAQIVQAKRDKLLVDNTYTTFQEEVDRLWESFWKSSFAYGHMQGGLKALVDFQHKHKNTKLPQNLIVIRDAKQSTLSSLIETLHAMYTSRYGLHTQVSDFMSCQFCSYNCYNGLKGMHVNYFGSGPPEIGKTNMLLKLQEILIPGSCESYTCMPSAKQMMTWNPNSYITTIFSEMPYHIYTNAHKLSGATLEQQDILKEILTSCSVNYSYLGFANQKDSTPQNRKQYQVKSTIHTVIIGVGNQPMSYLAGAMLSRFFKNIGTAAKNSIHARHLMFAKAMQDVSAQQVDIALNESILLWLRMVQLLIAKYHMFINVKMTTKAQGFCTVVPHLITNFVMEYMEKHGKRGSARDAERVIALAQEVCLFRVINELLFFPSSLSEANTFTLGSIAESIRWMKNIEERAVVTVEDTVFALHMLAPQWCTVVEDEIIYFLRNDLLKLNTLPSELNHQELNKYYENCIKSEMVPAQFRQFEKKAQIRRQESDWVNKNTITVDPNYITITMPYSTLVTHIANSLACKPQAADVKHVLDGLSTHYLTPTNSFKECRVSMISVVTSTEKRAIPVVRLEEFSGSKLISISVDYLINYKGTDLLYTALMDLRYKGLRSRTIFVVDHQTNQLQALTLCNARITKQEFSTTNVVEQNGSAIAWHKQMQETHMSDQVAHSTVAKYIALLKASTIKIQHDLDNVAYNMYWCELGKSITEQNTLMKTIATIVKASKQNIESNSMSVQPTTATTTSIESITYNAPGTLFRCQVPELTAKNKNAQVQQNSSTAQPNPVPAQQNAAQSRQRLVPARQMSTLEEQISGLALYSEPTPQQNPTPTQETPMETDDDTVAE